MRYDEISSRTTLGDGFQNKNDGVAGSPPSGYEPNPDADDEHVKIVYREMAKRLSPQDWKAITEAFPDLPDDVLLPRNSNEQ